MASSQPVLPNAEQRIALIEENLGVRLALWAVSDGCWKPSSAASQVAAAPEALLDCAAAQPGRVVHHVQAGTGDRWIGIALEDAECGIRVAAGVDSNDPTHYAQRLADQALAAEQESENQELLDSYGNMLVDAYEELTFLRRLPQHLEYCEATRDLQSVAESTLADLRRLIAVDSLQLISAVNAAPEDGKAASGSENVQVQVGDAIATSGNVIALPKAWQACLLSTLQDSRGAVVRNLNGLQGPCLIPGVRSYVIAPVRQRGQVFGWLVGANKSSVEGQRLPGNSLCPDEIGSMEASLLEASAAMLATHAANSQLFAEKQQLTLDAIHTLVGVIEARDAYTCGHSNRVALVARRLAEAIRLPEADCHGVYLAGLLHDIGKVGIADDVLLKPGKLTDQEFMEIKEHPTRGYRLLQRLAPLGSLLPGVLHHHESFDGSGYPTGLSGEEIPLQARVLAVADAWDAMTSDRPYRDGMPRERAKQILRNGAGKQWDPNVVEAFFAITDEIDELTRSWQDQLQEVLASPDDNPTATPVLASLNTVSPLNASDYVK